MDSIKLFSILLLAGSLIIAPVKVQAQSPSESDVQSRVQDVLKAVEGKKQNSPGVQSPSSTPSNPFASFSNTGEYQQAELLGQIDRSGEKPEQLNRQYRQRRDEEVSRYQNLPRNVISHLRFKSSKRGIPFPSAEVLEQLKHMSPPVPREVRIAPAQDSLRLPVHKEASGTPKVLGRCSGSSEKELKLSEGIKSDKDRVLLDRLYMFKDDVPLSPEDQYGPGVEIKAYDPLEPEEKSKFFRPAFSMPCLPYRLRITAKTQFLYQGEAALQNFNEQKKQKNSPEV